MAIPPAPTSFSNGPNGPDTVLAHDMVDVGTAMDLFDDGASAQSPLLTAGYFRKAVCRVHDVLYGGRGKDRIEIDQVVRELYDTGAGQSRLFLIQGSWRPPERTSGSMRSKTD